MSWKILSFMKDFHFDDLFFSRYHYYIFASILKAKCSKTRCTFQSCGKNIFISSMTKLHLYRIRLSMGYLDFNLQNLVVSPASRLDLIVSLIILSWIKCMNLFNAMSKDQNHRTFCWVHLETLELWKWSKQHLNINFYFSWFVIGGKIN